jgi:hypothetical protein
MPTDTAPTEVAGETLPSSQKTEHGRLAKKQEICQQENSLDLVEATMGNRGPRAPVGDRRAGAT